jgi:hypothetical protein
VVDSEGLCNAKHGRAIPRIVHKNAPKITIVVSVFPDFYDALAESTQLAN